MEDRCEIARPKRTKTHLEALVVVPIFGLDNPKGGAADVGVAWDRVGEVDLKERCHSVAMAKAHPRAGGLMFLPGAVW